MKKFSLPSLRSKSQVFCNYIFNRKSYTFNFTWCGEFCLLDIYLAQEYGNKYIIKGFPIVTGIDLIARVKNPQLISGKLFIQNKYNKNLEPDLNNFNTDFELIYYEKGEYSEQ